MIARLRAVLTGQVAGGRVQVTESIGLGPGARLLVVRFGGRELLVAQSRAGVELLAEGPEA